MRGRHRTGGSAWIGSSFPMSYRQSSLLTPRVRVKTTMTARRGRTPGRRGERWRQSRGSCPALTVGPRISGLARRSIVLRRRRMRGWPPSQRRLRKIARTSCGGGIGHQSLRRVASSGNRLASFSFAFNPFEFYNHFRSWNGRRVGPKPVHESCHHKARECFSRFLASAQPVYWHRRGIFRWTMCVSSLVRLPPLRAWRCAFV